MAEEATSGSGIESNWAPEEPEWDSEKDAPLPSPLPLPRVESAWRKELGGPAEWDVCEDIRVTGDNGEMIYKGPRYLRCVRQECGALVTHGQVQQGGCICGSRRLAPATKLSVAEKTKLKAGLYPMVRWEVEATQPFWKGKVVE